MNQVIYSIYYLCKTYNQASKTDSINKLANNQFTYNDFRKEFFDASVNCFIKNPLYREFIKAYVQ